MATVSVQSPLTADRPAFDRPLSKTVVSIINRTTVTTDGRRRRQNRQSSPAVARQAPVARSYAGVDARGR